MEEVFKYIIGLGAAVMMPIIFTVLGLCIGIKFGDALKSGLKVGVGFVGLSVITALLTSSLGPALDTVVSIYDLQLHVFDMGWPAAAAVAYNTAVGAFIIPVCLGVNLLMLFTKTTRTVNIDLWNYWHFAFIGAVVYFASRIACMGILRRHYMLCHHAYNSRHDRQEIPGFLRGHGRHFDSSAILRRIRPFAWIINKGLDRIPGFDKLNVDAEGLKKNSVFSANPSSSE